MSQIVADGVAVLIYRKGKAGLEFLQLHRAESSDYHPGSWQICYGGVREGEAAPDAALREMREETGLRPRLFFQVEYVETFYFRPRDAVVMMPVFGAEVGTGDEPTLNEEHDGHRWVDEADVGKHFVWRSQRQGIAVLIEQVRNPGQAERLLGIPLE